ncbi:GNAT family N-acetyltransferase [Rhodococcus erythropolis]
MTETVAHNPAETRFEIRVDGELAGFAEYSDHAGVRDFHHTVTYPRFRGRGLAAIVVREALDQTRNEGLKILPTCSYVEKFVAENPVYQA